jgi:RimJ/RimL family protein N-acetyltransferase
MPLSPSTLAAISGYWAGFFGCSLRSFTTAGVQILPHAELEEYRGLFCLRREATTLLCVPPDQLVRWQAVLASLDVDELIDPQAMARHLGVAPTQVIGPAVVAYADAATLRPLPTPGTRLLTALDEDAHAALEAACEPLAWAHGGSEFALLPLAGRFVRGQLVALAGYEPWGEQIAHIAVVTHPAHRGQGYGAEAVSLLAETVIARGMIAQYRTLRNNTPSLRLGASLGFVPFAETLAVRFTTRQ